MSQKPCCTPENSVGPQTPSQKISPLDRTAGYQFQRINSGNTDDMVLLEGLPFLMGTNGDIGYPEDGEGPEREITLSPFYIDKYSVTNRQFTEFVKATRYKTEAELYGWSFVFHLLIPPYLKEKHGHHRVSGTQWWLRVEGADWKHPEGPHSSLKKRMDHPAVHLSWNDAIYYCEWAGKRLPTEAEWEYAARGGSQGTLFPWGDTLTIDGQHQCNTFQGVFPTNNTAEDGYLATSPAFAYAPNNYGLFNMLGNVWEWTQDWFSPSFHQQDQSEDPLGPITPERGRNSKVIKGGSYLCHESYCNRYRIAARTHNSPESSTGNMGFRCVRDV